MVPGPVAPEKRSNIPNFETIVRRMRYQQLGTACRNHEIQRLLLGHHQDDQVETLVSRIVSGSSRLGLDGMSPVSNIPESHGIWGVHESTSGYQGRPFVPRSMSETEDNSDQINLERGGVQIGRPLLPFMKDRLVATCDFNRISYHVDKTNFDPTLTRRNAIRHVFQKPEILPQVLQKEALLAMAARNAHRKEQETALAEAIFNQCALKLESRPGSLLVDLPSIESVRALRRQHAPDMDDEDVTVVDALFIRRLASMVTPRETIPLDQLQKAVETMNPQGLQYEDPWIEVQLTSAEGRFTCAGLQFDRGGLRRWRLTRQNPSKEERLDQVILLQKKIEDVLFDSRFWIHVRTPAGINTPLVVRFLSEQDLTRLRQWPVDKEKMAALEAELYRLARGHQRFSLPVIAIATKRERLQLKLSKKIRKPEWDLPPGKFGLGDAISLPTLGFTLDEMFVGEWNWLQSMRYHVKFRKVDFGLHSQDNVLASLNPPSEAIRKLHASAAEDWNFAETPGGRKAIREIEFASFRDIAAKKRSRRERTQILRRILAGIKLEIVRKGKKSRYEPKGFLKNQAYARALHKAVAMAKEDHARNQLAQTVFEPGTGQAFLTYGERKARNRGGVSREWNPAKASVGSGMILAAYGTKKRRDPRMRRSAVRRIKIRNNGKPLAFRKPVNMVRLSATGRTSKTLQFGNTKDRSTEHTAASEDEESDHTPVRARYRFRSGGHS